MSRSHDTYKYDGSTDTVELPVGLHWEGQVYKTVVIDEMTGVDEENIADKKNKGREIDVLLRRCIQSIPGLVESKKNPDALLGARYTDAMFQADRDFLLMAIRIFSMEPSLLLEWKCNDCGSSQETSVDLTQIPVTPWPADEDPELAFTLPRGVRHEGKRLKGGALRFPTGKMQRMVMSQSGRNAGKLQTILFAASIPELDGVPTDQMMFRRMSTQDRQAIAQVILTGLPGVRFATDLECDDCGHEEHDHPFDLKAFFASPTSTRSGSEND